MAKNIPPASWQNYITQRGNTTEDADDEDYDSYDGGFIDGIGAVNMDSSDSLNSQFEWADDSETSESSSGRESDADSDGFFDGESFETTQLTSDSILSNEFPFLNPSNLRQQKKQRDGPSQHAVACSKRKSELGDSFVACSTGQLALTRTYYRYNYRVPCEYACSCVKMKSTIPAISFQGISLNI